MEIPPNANPPDGVGQAEDAPPLMLVVTGPCGVGKTSVAWAISEIFTERDLPHAFLDMDALRNCHPSPQQDPFHIALGLRNLAAVWPHFRDAGARRLVLADVVESEREIAGYHHAAPEAVLWITRLNASIPTLHARLEGRETGESLAWHQRRAVELSALMDRAALEDGLVETDGKTVEQVALEALEGAGWQ